MLSQRILPQLSIVVALFAPAVSAAPQGVSLSRDIVRQIIADNSGHIPASSPVAAQPSPKADQLETRRQIARFDALRQATLIVRQIVQQAPDKAPEAAPAIAEPTVVVAQQATPDTGSMIADVKTEVDTLLSQSEPPAAGMESDSRTDFAALLATNDFQKASTYQSYEGLSFGDNRNRVRNGLWSNFKTFKATRRPQNGDEFAGGEARGDAFTAGLETNKLFPGTLFGAALTLGNTRLTPDTPDDYRKKIRSLTFSLYSSWTFDTAFLEAGMSFGRARNETRRMETDGGTGHLEGKFYATTTHARLLAGNIYNLTPDWTLTPLAELNYNRISFDHYTEAWDSDCTGTCIDPTTKYRPESQSSMEGGLGFNLAGQLGTGKARLVPFASLMGYYNFRRDTVSEGHQGIYITGIDQLVMTGPERHRGRARFSFGLSLLLDESLRLDLGVIRNQMKGYRSDSGNLKLRYKF